MTICNNYFLLKNQKFMAYYEYFITFYFFLKKILVCHGILIFKNLSLQIVVMFLIFKLIKNWSQIVLKLRSLILNLFVANFNYK